MSTLYELLLMEPAGRSGILNSWFKFMVSQNDSASESAGKFKKETDKIKSLKDPTQIYWVRIWEDLLY